MFSGIIESVAELVKVGKEGTNKVFTIKHTIQDDLYIDQSISHNGVCLSIVEIDAQQYKVEAIKETLERSILDMLKAGDRINLERCLLPSSRIDGHLVSGHVDCKGKITQIIDNNGSWDFEIRFPSEYEDYVIEKGSICLNGISLTITNIEEDLLSVSIIPYTYENTNFKDLQIGEHINIEFDNLGKYVIKYLKKINS